METELEKARAKLQNYKDRGLIHDFEIRDPAYAVVTLLVPLGGFDVATDAANRIVISTHRVVPARRND